MLGAVLVNSGNTRLVPGQGESQSQAEESENIGSVTPFKFFEIGSGTKMAFGESKIIRSTRMGGEELESSFKIKTPVGRERRREG